MAFLLEHINLVLGLCAAALWGGAGFVFFYEDIRRAWAEFRNR